MCTITDVKIDNINKKLDILVDGQKTSDERYVIITAHMAVSNERWTAQKKLNDKLEKSDLRNKIWNGTNSIIASVAGYLGFDNVLNIFHFDSDSQIIAVKHYKD